jgi:phosphoglycerate dehydrogenase-like enzyme
MSTPRVYIHRAGSWYSLFLDKANETMLSSFAEVVCERDSEVPLPATELIERMSGCSAVLSLNGYGANDITAEVLKSVRTVRVICISHFWGWGHFTSITKDTGISVVEGSNAGTVAVAEWIVAAALMGIRRLHLFDRALKNGSKWGEPRHNASMLSESVVGLVGLGRIGLYAARYFRALGANVIAYSRSCSVEKAEALGFKLVSLGELMSTADVISLHHRVADNTRGMFGANEFSLIKPGCIFINSARAGLYDERALIRELKSGRFTAYIDVFATEPLPLDHPFRTMNNVIITPHIAGNNPAMFRRCGREAIETLKDYFAGKGLVDKRYAYPEACDSVCN